MKQKWITQNIPDLTGKVIIVTGGNSGLGYESVKAFAQKGATVILTSRSKEKGEEAKRNIGNVSGKIEVLQLDLMDFESIKNFSENFKKHFQKLDVLLNNAGIMTTPYFLTKNGLEAQTGTNHFGHFALTGHLMDVIKNSPGCRIVNVSSMAHKQGQMDFDNLLFENGKGYTPMKSYGRSKLMNLLFTYELQRFFEKNNIEALALAAHPGGSRTNLDRFLKEKFWFKLLWPVWRLISMDQAKGALSQIRASVDENVQGGEYYGPHKGMTGFPEKVESNAASHKKDDAEKLWKISEELTNINFE